MQLGRGEKEKGEKNLANHRQLTFRWEITGVKCFPGQSRVCDRAFQISFVSRTALFCLITRPRETSTAFSLLGEFTFSRYYSPCFVLFFSWRFRVHRDVKQVDIMHGIAASKRLREAKGIRFHASYTFLLLLLYIYRYII